MENLWFEEESVIMWLDGESVFKWFQEELGIIWLDEESACVQMAGFEEESSTHTSHNGRHFLPCTNGTVCSAIGEEGIVTRIPNDHIQQQQELCCPPFSSSALTFSPFQSLLLLLLLLWVPLNLSLSLSLIILF